MIRFSFIAVLVFWLVVPLVIRDTLAQDALPYVVAGGLVQDHPAQVYAAQEGDLFNLEPLFAERSCAIAPVGTACSSLTVAFVSTPPAIPFAVLISGLGPDNGVLVMRLLAGMCLSGGMWVLWRRLSTRTRNAGSYLLVTALFLTPFAMVSLSLGQTSPVLFLSAAMGLSRADRWGRAIATAALWVAAVVLKAFPAALGLVLLWQRRGKVLVSAAGMGAVLAAITLLIGPLSLWTGFVDTAKDLSGNAGANPYNGSLDALIHNIASPITDGAVGGTALFVLRVVLAGGLLWWSAKHLDDDTQWAYAYLLALLVVPLVWWHYLWLAIAAVGLALVARPRLDDRALVALPVLAAITVPISIPNSRGWSIPVAQGLFLLATVALVPLLAHPRTPAVSPVDDRKAGDGNPADA